MLKEKTTKRCTNLKPCKIFLTYNLVVFSLCVILRIIVHVYESVLNTRPCLQTGL